MPHTTYSTQAPSSRRRPIPCSRRYDKEFEQIMRSWLVLMVCLLAAPAAGDEGLWPFNQFPSAAIKQKYNLEITEQFLDNLRLASVRIGGGAGAFVSANGLVLTNQHLIAGCLAERNEGFYAAAQSAERQCPGLAASVLMKIEDVTKQVKGEVKESGAAAQALAERKAAMARIEQDCGAKTGYTCTVVTLFSGGRYDLYQYKNYTDLRLVFAPEEALAFFGRERDSITYLRYGLDIAFLRAYENGQPAATPHYLKWSAEGVKEGGQVFAAGNPGATARATTAAQLTFLRDSALPLIIGRLGARVRQIRGFASQNEESYRATQPVLTAFLESYKAAAGKLIGLRDDRLVGRKTSFDQRIRRAVEADPKLGTEAGKVWDEVARAYKSWGPLEKPYQILEAAPAPGSVLYRVARRLVRSEPLAADADVAANTALETLLLAQYIEELKTLGERDAPLKGAVSGKTSLEAAEALMKASTLKDPAERRRLAADRSALAKSADGVIRLAQRLEEPAQRLRKKREELIGSLETSATEKIAQYRFRLFGAADYPDGTNTPRVAFGVVKGYTDRAGVGQPYAATFGGLYYRRNNEGPYQVPQRWIDAKQKLNLVTPLDFVSTCDVGGGDSGSPTVNSAGELVGVIFDGNLESLPATYLYIEEQARAVHVAVQGIAEALEKVYQAKRLLEELGVTVKGGGS